MKTRLVLLGALLIPAIAVAQPVDPAQPAPAAPAAPQAPQAPQTPQTPQTPQATQAPAVVVNPPVAAPAPSVVETGEPQYEEVYDSYNAPVFTTGALVFAASYGASVVVAASSDDNNDRGNHRLYVPVVGPWLALSDRGSCDVSLSRCDHETTAKVLLVADGVFQAAGLIGMLDGVFQPSSHRVLQRTAKVDTKIHVTPTVANGDPGLAVFGKF
jgi:hypothetical protein